MSSFIPVAVAHDATCDKGDEWLFHGMAEGKVRMDIDDNGKVKFVKDRYMRHD